MEQGKIMEAEVLTVRVGATPTGLTAPPPPQPPPRFFLQAGCPSYRPINIVKALLVSKQILFRRELQTCTEMVLFCYALVKTMSRTLSGRLMTPGQVRSGQVQFQSKQVLSLV